MIAAGRNLLRLRLYRQGIYHILARSAARKILELWHDNVNANADVNIDADVNINADVNIDVDANKKVEDVCTMANMKIANIKSTRICAFCRNWYDPANAAIVPKAPQAGFFEYNHNARNKCTLTGLDQLSWASCGKFSCKF